VVDPFVGQRFIATKRVKGQRFRQTVFTNREKKSGTLTVASGTVLTFIGVEKGLIVDRWRFTADKLAGVEVRIPAEDAKRRLAPVDAPASQPATTAPSPQPPPPQGRPYETDASSRSPDVGVAEELERFVALRDSGALTQEEFDTQKARLLGGAPRSTTSDASGGIGSQPSDGADLYDVYLIETGSQTISVIKVLRDLTDAQLAETKRLVESVPQRILAGVRKEDADQAARLLDEAGARIRTQPAGTAFAGELGTVSNAAVDGRPWFKRPATYLKIFLGWLLLFGIGSCLAWLGEEPEASTAAQEASTSTPTPPPAPAPTPRPAPTPAPAPSAPSGQGLQRILDTLVAGAAELADFVAMYEETGFSLGTAEACLALEQGYRRFDILPELDGSQGIALENAKVHYFNAQRDCRRALDRQDVALFIRSVQSADAGFVEILGLYSRLSN